MSEALVAEGQHGFFGEINFSSQNEGWDSEARALQLSEEDSVLCITGSGDRPLNLLCDTGVSRIVAIDLAPMQNHLLRLKVAAIATLDHDEYLRFLGQHPAPGDERLSMYATVRGALSANAQVAWDARSEDLKRGVLYCGRFERYFAKVAMLASKLRPRVVQRLFTFGDLDEQRRFVRDEWDTRIWRWVFRALLHPATSRLFYGDPAYYAHVGVPVGDYLYDRILSYLDRHLAKESFMLSLVFTGQLRDDNLPPYLTEQGHALLRSRLDRLEIVTADLLEHMPAQRWGTYSRFSLSDVPSYLREGQFQRLLTMVRRCATEDARIVIRQFLTTYEIAPHQRDVFLRDEALELELAADDQALAYRFIVSELNPEPSGSGDGVVVRPYTPADDAEALALERQCIQGEEFQLTFRRSMFRRRAENFDDYFIAVAEVDGELVGTGAAALKNASVFGQPRRVAFFFDTRVRPDMRGRGIARRISVDVFGWAFRQVHFGYLYTVADNRIVRYLMDLGTGEEVGGYRYLVIPTTEPLEPVREPRTATFDEVHESMVATQGPFDFYCDPREVPNRSPHVGSWMIDDGEDVAACSAWDNRDILAEVIERVPWRLALLGWVARHVPALGKRLPKLPTPGEELRSWYIFDFHATRPDLARDLMRYVAARAKSNGVDYCYIVVADDVDWFEAVRHDVPRTFAPVIPYTLIAGWSEGRLPPMKRIYVDIRDL